MTCTKQEICVHAEYCQRHIGQNFDGCILFSRHLFSRDGKSMTNEEWFSSMHTEEKAKWLADHMKCSKCPQQKRCNGYHGGCMALMLEWLKEKRSVESGM